MGIEAVTYAVMSNHLHVNHPTLPDLPEGWLTMLFRLPDLGT